MKIIHSADWHIGKIVNEFSMIDDQKYILNELYKLIKSEKPEVLIVAGDIYDRSVAPVEAIDLLDSFFTKVINDIGVTILVIAGNHDSGQRLQFGNNIFEKQGLHIKGNFNGDIDKIRLSDENGIINFYLVPYVHPEVVRKKYEDSNIKSHNDAMKIIIDKIKEKFNKQERNVLITHGYVTMNREKALEEEKDRVYEVAELEESDSERPLSIGGTDLIDGNLFSMFNYTALGHLHGQQRVGSNKIRYSGSLLKYSFSEINHKKGVDIIEIDKNGELEVRHEELKPIREMRMVKGKLEEIIKAALEEDGENEDYILATLTDEGEILEPMQRLRSVYPNTMLIKRQEVDINNIETEKIRDLNRKRSHLELFEEYYQEVSNREFTDEKRELMKSIVNEVLRKEL